jgi:ribose/xylose/arabinose/galactoside ABC-type transport system permease subunit
MFKPKPETLRVLVILVALVIALALFVPRFASPLVFGNIMGRAATDGMLAAGLTLVLLTRHIDLSIGSISALAAAVAISVAHSLPVALLIGAAVGVAAGLVNGGMVIGLRINSFIATLGSMIVLRGLTFLYEGGQAIRGDMLEQSLFINRFWIAAMAPRVFFMLALVAIYALLSGPMRWGLELRAVGGDPLAARAAGIPVGRRTIGAFALSGLAAGLAGGVIAVSLNGATPNLGATSLLSVLAAVIIGGTSLLGGRGSMIGSLLGVLLLSTLAVGLNLLRVDTPVQQIIVGVLLLGMVILDRRGNLVPGWLRGRRTAAPRPATA